MTRTLPPPAIQDPRAAEDAVIVVHVSDEDGIPRILPAWLAREFGEPIPSEMVRAGSCRRTPLSRDQ